MDTVPSASDQTDDSLRELERRWRGRLQARVPSTTHEGRFPPDTPLRPSAVLLPLLLRPDGYHILFTVRAAHLAHHAGQISFPGGRHEPGDPDLWWTARRETHEEIGLPPDQVVLVAALDPIISITRFHVTPFAGMVPGDFPYRSNPDEVAEILIVPLRHLQDAACHEVEMRPIPGQDPVAIHHFQFGQHDIWGMTGHIVHHFLATIAGE